MTQNFFKTLFVIFLSVIPAFLTAQESFQQQLQQYYDAFDFEAVDSLLLDAQSRYDQLSALEKVAYHQYSALKEYQNGKLDDVNDHFIALLNIDPTFRFDPVNTSPKLLLLFEKAKADFLKERQDYINSLEERLMQPNMPWRSLVFPGWEQWHRGHKNKAYIWMSLGIVTLGGTVQALIRTSSARDDYLKASDPIIIDSKYNRYNRLYKSQYYWAYSMATVWLSAHLDALLFTPDRSLNVSLYPRSKRAELSLSIYF